MSQWLRRSNDRHKRKIVNIGILGIMGNTRNDSSKIVSINIIVRTIQINMHTHTHIYIYVEVIIVLDIVRIDI